MLIARQYVTPETLTKAVRDDATPVFITYYHTDSYKNTCGFSTFCLHFYSRLYFGKQKYVTDESTSIRNCGDAYKKSLKIHTEI